MSKEVELDSPHKPSNVWMNPYPDEMTFINICPKCQKNYSCGACGHKESLALRASTHETLVNLYNALHEALYERDMEHDHSSEC